MASPEPNLQLDAAALFRHRSEIGMPEDDACRWSFMFQALEVEQLVPLAEELDARLRGMFHVVLQESMEVVDPEGNFSDGPPVLMLDFVGTLDQAAVAGLHERLTALAEEYEVEYLGVSSYSEMPFEIETFDMLMSDACGEGCEHDH